MRLRSCAVGLSLFSQRMAGNTPKRQEARRALQWSNERYVFQIAGAPIRRVNATINFRHLAHTEKQLPEIASRAHVVR